MLPKNFWALVAKPSLSSALAGLAAWLHRPDLMYRALRLDRDNLKALRHLWQAEGLDLQRLERFLLAPGLVQALGSQHLTLIESAFSDSRAQLLQDLFVLAHLGCKREGYFVEIGVGDGQYLSNTWLLEKNYGWKGILAEPNQSFSSSIRGCRDAILDVRAVWSASGEQLSFLDVPHLRELSTLSQFRHSDRHDRSGREYSVRTVTLNDLLAAHHAPSVVDYVSIDTEGSEWDILQGLDFDRYHVRVFTIEHNHSEDKLERITKLLQQHHYVRVHERCSRFDAWFVSAKGP